MKRRTFQWMAWLLALALILAVPAAAVSDDPSAWAAEEVAAAREADLVPETLEGNYDAPITRAEFCALAAQLYRVWAAAQTVPQVPEVQRVPFGDCADADVLFCAALGVVNGVGDGLFNPDAPIRRQDAAAMLHRLAALRKDFDDAPAMPHVFDDGADLRSWARSDVYWAYASGVMQGVGENRFDPNGTYTREQSILTMLRLYDSDYAEPPEETETEPPYRAVTHNIGVGVHRAHLEDAEGNWLLTDLWDAEGSFYMIDVFGSWIGLTTPDFQMGVYNMATGELLEDWQLGGYDEQYSVGWAILPTEEVKATGFVNRIVYADGTMGDYFNAIGSWWQGRSMVKLDDHTFAAIDREGTILWQYHTDETWSVMPSSGIGDRLRADTADGYRLLVGGQLHTFPSGIWPSIPKWSTNYICGQNGYYTIYDADGNVLFGPHRNSIQEVGQDLYCRWVDDHWYLYFRCAPGGTPETLFVASTGNTYPSDLPTDGGGVYAMRTGTREVTVFDRFGDILSVLHTDFDLDGDARVEFRNGCVLVGRDYNMADDPAQWALYLPTGEKIG